MGLKSQCEAELRAQIIPNENKDRTRIEESRQNSNFNDPSFCDSMRRPAFESALDIDPVILFLGNRHSAAVLTSLELE